MNKFSGRQGEDNFEVWLQDYVEAAEDCGWDDEKHARWFSWFLPGSRQCQYNTRQIGARSQRCIVANMGSTLTLGQHTNVVMSYNMSGLAEFRDSQFNEGVPADGSIEADRPSA